MKRHLTQVCRILPFQYKMFFVSISFSLSSSVGYLDLLEIVQEHAVFERPSMFLLSVSVGRIDTLFFPAIYGSIYGFPVMVLPLFRSMALSCCSSLDYVQRICKDVDSSFNFVCVFLRGYQTLTASAVDCPSELFQACRH